MLELLCPTSSSVTLVLGQNVPSARSHVTSGWEKESGHCKENRAAIQRDLSILEEWASKDCVMAKACTLGGVAILGAAGQVAPLQKKTGRS